MLFDEDLKHVTIYIAVLCAFGEENHRIYEQYSFEIDKVYINEQVL